MKANIKVEIELPEGVTAVIVDGVLTVKGKEGENVRDFTYPTVSTKVENGKIVLSSDDATKREKKMIGTFNSHIKNLVSGVLEKFVYKLKICSGHFPMNVSVSGNKIIVKNFLGEKHPREYEFPQGVEIKVNGTEIEIKSCSKELAGRAASAIEKLCNITNRDRRIFQDGIWMIVKAGKEL